MSMPEIGRLSGHRNWIDLDFVEREQTSEPAMALSIQSHVSGLSLSNSVELLEAWGVGRSRKAIVERIFRRTQAPNVVILELLQSRGPETAESWLQTFARWHNTTN